MRILFFLHSALNQKKTRNIPHQLWWEILLTTSVELTLSTSTRFAGSQWTLIKFLRILSIPRPLRSTNETKVSFTLIDKFINFSWFPVDVCIKDTWWGTLKKNSLSFSAKFCIDVCIKDTGLGTQKKLIKFSCQRFSGNYTITDLVLNFMNTLEFPRAQRQWSMSPQCEEGDMITDAVLASSGPCWVFRKQYFEEILSHQNDSWKIGLYCTMLLQMIICTSRNNTKVFNVSFNIYIVTKVEIVTF